MKGQDIFIIIAILILIFFYITKMCETYASGSYDITPSITVAMDWKGSQLSGLPYYPNNLINASGDVDVQIKKLQSYQPKEDGVTDTTYVSANMQFDNNENNPNLPDDLENFSMMNHFIKDN